jgi:membrane-associated protein
MELFSPLADALDAVLGLVTDTPWTYLLILVLAVFDVFFPVLPAETSVVIAAVLAGTGELNIAWVIVAAAAGAFIGDNLAYLVGRHAGRPLVDRFLRDHATRIDVVGVRFQQQGGSLIIIGRFVPWGRTIVAVSAGVLRMRWRTYLAYEALAAVIWALQAAIPGYIGGLAFRDRPWLALIVGISLSLSIAAGLEVIRRRRLSRVLAADDTPGADAHGPVRGPGDPVPPAPERDRPPEALDAGLGPRRARRASLVPVAAGGRADAHADGDHDDPEPGEERGPEQPVVSEAQSVAKAGRECLSRPGPRDRRREDEEELTPGSTPEDDVEAGVEGSDEQRQHDRGC